MFIGYPRSGHSLVGSMLDAHPNIVIGHEVNVLKQFQRGFKPDFILARIISKAESFFNNEGKRTGYKYLIPNQYNGKFKDLKVIGDKKGGASSLLLNEDFSLLKKLDEFNKKIKMIHVIRNPFDNIATRARGGNLIKREVTTDLLDEAIEAHKNDLEVIQRIKNLNKYDILDLYYEDLVQDPRTNIKRLFDFLNIKTDPQFIFNCSSILFRKPKKTSTLINWSESQISHTNQLCADFNFINRYIDSRMRLTG